MARVDVFWADLRHRDLTPARFLPLLSQQERGRAAKYRRDGDRDRFIVRRGLLRRVLAVYAGRPPEALPIETGEFGKPCLPGTEIGFSLSQSGDIALFAVGRGVSLGCDIERLDPQLASIAAAACVFTPEQMRMLLAAPPHRRVRCFYRIWTSLEARLKASGCGFLAGNPGDIGPPEDCSSRWLTPEPGYTACVAVLRDPPPLPTCRTMHPSSAQGRTSRLVAGQAGQAAR